MQVAAVEALTAVVESQLVSGSDVVELLLPSVLANINVAGTPDEVCPITEIMQCIITSADLARSLGLLTAALLCNPKSSSALCNPDSNSPAVAYAETRHCACTGCECLAEVFPCHSSFVGQNTHKSQDFASGVGKGCQ